MATVVRMPEVLANTGEAVIQTWLVSVGQEIAIGDPLAEIETEKAVVEYVSEVDGIVGRLIAEPGSTIAVGEPIAVVLAPGETDADIDAAAHNGVAVSPTPEPELAAVGVAEPASAANRRRLFATPLVRKLARERGIELETVSGTGPGGRIVRRDLERLPVAEPTPTPQPVRTPAVVESHRTATGFTDIPLTPMRKAIARRLTESKTTVPHFYVTADCRVDELLELRRNVNAAAALKVSLNDFIVKAVAGALI
jgi:pyruvate dehydrogenase E2 component (dihydrolipoamide acetyltransferase)